MGISFNTTRWVVVFLAELIFGAMGFGVEVDGVDVEASGLRGGGEFKRRTAGGCCGSWSTARDITFEMAKGNWKLSSSG